MWLTETAPKTAHTTAQQSAGGFSLVELLVAMALGLASLAMIGGFYSSFFRLTAQQAAASRLEMDLSALMELMMRDIRRAGYWSGAAALVGSGQTTPAEWQLMPETWREHPDSDGNDYDCLLFSYDIDHNGSYRDVTAAEPGRMLEGFGYRYNAAQQRVELREQAADCDSADHWFPLTENSGVLISELRFELEQQSVTDGSLTLISSQITLELAGERSGLSRSLSQSLVLPNLEVR